MTRTVDVGPIQIDIDDGCCEIRIPGADRIVTTWSFEEALPNLPALCYEQLPQAEAVQMIAATCSWVGRYFSNRHLLESFVNLIKSSVQV